MDFSFKRFLYVLFCLLISKISFENRDIKQTQLEIVEPLTSVKIYSKKLCLWISSRLLSSQAEDALKAFFCYFKNKYCLLSNDQDGV